MFPPLFPIYIPALAPLHEWASLIWLGGVVCLWVTRYTHQLAARWGGAYYTFSMLTRPLGVALIALGWLALYAPEHPFYPFQLGWLPRGSWVDVLIWLAILAFFALGIWSVITLGVRRSFLFRHYDDPLITHGPYALVRHPQFLSALGITFFGIILFDPVSFSFVVYGRLGANWALFAVALWTLAILEDRELEAHFGDDYRQYVQRVPRLFPN